MALALGTRRSTAAAVTSVVAPAGPEVTVRDLVQAAKTGDRDAIFDLLTPATQARLDAFATRATDLVGAAVRYTAKDLISIGTSDGVATPTDITVIDERGDRATVEVVSPNGRARLELQKSDGRWRVDLPQFDKL